VDLSAAFYAARAVFPLMASRGGGTIVNVSSVAGRKGWANAAAYCAAKFGLTGLSQAINSEGTQAGIRCCVLYPGGMDTDWMPGGQPEFLAPSSVADIIVAVVSQPLDVMSTSL
jgi:NAD(P)-dependent dehydrogenase (short-subunit alcohol dehydrogenase family)